MKRRRDRVEAVALTNQRVEDPGEPLSDLGQRLRHSDRAAFAEVFQRLHAPLVRYARRITGDEGQPPTTSCKTCS